MGYQFHPEKYYRIDNQFTDTFYQNLKLCINLPYYNYILGTNKYKYKSDNVYINRKKNYLLFILMCIISYLSFNDNIYLAKNRDRYYITPIKLVRDYMNGTEILYIHDIKSGWIEGINEYGISLINSVLPVTREEIVLKSKESKVFGKESSSSDGAIILKALSQCRIQDALTILLKCNCHGKGAGLFGHTILSDGEYTISIEYTSKSIPIIKSINNLYVRTNHTIDLSYKKGGYHPNKNRGSYISSIKRLNYIKNKLVKITHPDDILDIMSFTDYQNPCSSPYRIGKRCDHIFHYGFATTSQLLLDISNLILILKLDKYHSKYLGFTDKMSITYPDLKPKIKFNIFTINRPKYKDSKLKKY